MHVAALERLVLLSRANGFGERFRKLPRWVLGFRRPLLGRMFVFCEDDGVT